MFFCYASFVLHRLMRYRLPRHEYDAAMPSALAALRRLRRVPALRFLLLTERCRPPDAMFQLRHAARGAIFYNISPPRRSLILLLSIRHTLPPRHMLNIHYICHYHNITTPAVSCPIFRQSSRRSRYATPCQIHLRQRRCSAALRLTRLLPMLLLRDACVDIPRAAAQRAPRRPPYTRSIESTSIRLPMTGPSPNTPIILMMPPSIC